MAALVAICIMFGGIPVHCDDSRMYLINVLVWVDSTWSDMAPALPGIQAINKRNFRVILQFIYARLKKYLNAIKPWILSHTLGHYIWISECGRGVLEYTCLTYAIKTVPDPVRQKMENFPLKCNIPNWDQIFPFIKTWFGFMHFPRGDKYIRINKNTRQ